MSAIHKLPQTGKRTACALKAIFFLTLILWLMEGSMVCLAQTAYITNFYDNTVSVINVTTNIVNATIAVGSYPYEVSVSPDGTKVYVANNGDNTISVINTSTNTVTSTITIGYNHSSVSVSPDGTKI